MRWKPLGLVLLLLVAGLAATEARFAASTGFSGRNVDCTSCHAASGAPAADAHMAGLPDTWWPGRAYDLQLGVSGGPMALPAPQPQGGFELEVEAGRLGPGPGMGPLLRFPEPTIATYEPEGTLQREWYVVWTAPPAHQPPAPVTFWLAAVAANGNHVIATNISDGGETGDAVATLVVTVPPAPEAVEAWQALPLATPVVGRLVEAEGEARIEGRHTDANATHIAHRWHGGEWELRETQADWTLVVQGGLEGLELRSEGAGRTSPWIEVQPAKQTPAGLGVFALCAGLAWHAAQARRRSR